MDAQAAGRWQPDTWSRGANGLGGGSVPGNQATNRWPVAISAPWEFLKKNRKF